MIRPTLVALLATHLTACSSPQPVSQPAPKPVPTQVSAEEQSIAHRTLAADEQRAPGTISPRRGDEIMVAGTLVHTGAPVRLWFDPPHYDHYRTTYRFKSEGQREWSADNTDVGSPNRFNDRPGKPNAGWTLDSLAPHVDQLVMHYDVCGTSRQCFKVLHDLRGLSIHFMVDVDGTIYQALDVADRAWHATIANDRSVGIEIAQIGAYPRGDSTLDDWYEPTPAGTEITLPAWLGDGGILTPGPWYTATPDRIAGTIHDRPLEQHDFTNAQYDSLAKLTAALNAVLPNIQLQVPREPTGLVLNRQLDPDEFSSFQGVLGHYHIQLNKVDPGPAFDWDRVLRGARLHRTAITQN